MAPVGEETKCFYLFFKRFVFGLFALFDRIVDRQERGREMGIDMRQISLSLGVEPAMPTGHHSPCRVRPDL